MQHYKTLQSSRDYLQIKKDSGNRRICSKTWICYLARRDAIGVVRWPRQNSALPKFHEYCYAMVFQHESDSIEHSHSVPNALRASNGKIIMLSAFQDSCFYPFLSDSCLDSCCIVGDSDFYQNLECCAVSSCAANMSYSEMRDPFVLLAVGHMRRKDGSGIAEVGNDVVVRVVVDTK